MSPKDVEATNLQNAAEQGTPTAPGYSMVPEQPTDGKFKSVLKFFSFIYFVDKFQLDQKSKLTLIE